MLITINDARTLILSGQCLLDKDKNSVVQVVSDLSGIQYDPCPILHLNHYKRNLFTVPIRELDLYNAATERIVHRGGSREQQISERRSNELLAAEEEKLLLPL